MAGAADEEEEPRRDRASGSVADLLYRHEVGLKPFLFAAFGRLSHLAQRSVRLTVPLAVLAVFTFVPFLPDLRIQHMLGIFAFVALMWGLETVPLPVTALAAPVLLVAYGVFGTGRSAVVEAFSPFADPVVYLMMGGLFIGEAFRKTGLDRRFLYFLVGRSGGRVRTLLLALMGSAGALSMWITNTAAAAMLVPLAVVIASRLKGERAKEYGAMLILGTGIAITAGGMATIVGFSGNVIAASFLAERVSFTFLDWMKVGVPLSVATILLAYLLLRTRIPREARADLTWLAEESARLGPLSVAEKTLVVIFGATVFLWILGGEVAKELGLTPEIASASVISLTAALFLFGSHALEWEDARDIPWEIFLILGAGLALGRGMLSSGAAGWIAGGMSGFIPAAGSPGSLLLLVLLAVVLAVVMSSFLGTTAGVAIFVPIAVGLADALALADPRILVFPVALGVLAAYWTPTSSPPFILVYSTGLVTRRDILQWGTLVTLPAILLVTVGAFFLASLL